MSIRIEIRHNSVGLYEANISDESVEATGLGSNPADAVNEAYQLFNTGNNVLFQLLNPPQVVVEEVQAAEEVPAAE